MLSSPVYLESHPRPCLTHAEPAFPPAFLHLLSLQRSSVPTIFDLTLLGSPHPNPLLCCQQSAPVNRLAATLMKLPVSVANKRLTEKLTPLPATLTKNRGPGVAAFQRFNRSARSAGI